MNENEKSDFNPSEISRITTQHNKDIGYLKKKVGELDSRVGDDIAFGKSFADCKDNSTILNDTVKKIIDDYDNHKIKTIGLSVAKWVAGIVIGAVLMQLANQVFLTPQHDREIESLKAEIEQIYREMNKD